MAANSRARKWKPEGIPSTVSTYLMCNGAQKVIDFMTDVFNAQELEKAMSDDKTTVKHAALNIDGSALMISDATKEYPAFPVWLYVYVEDVDKTYDLALSKGGESVQAPKDEFYGDRVSAVKDMAGNTWWIATHKFVPKPCSGDAKAE